MFINLYLKFLWFNFKENSRKCSPKALITYFYPFVLVVVSTYICEERRVDMIAGNIAFYM